MGIEEIKKKIIEDAEKERARMLREAKEKSSQIVEAGKRMAEKTTKEIISRAEMEAETEKSRMLTMENLESRKKILEAKQKVIDRVFSKALEDVLDLEDYEHILGNLLCKAAQGGEELILSLRDRKRLTEDFFSTLNARLGEPLKISEETRDITGGFILKTGNIEINECFDTKLTILRDEMESQVAQVLFSGDTK